MLRRGLAENIQQLLSCGHILTLISLSPSSSPCFMSLAWPDGMSLLKIDPLYMQAYKVELCDAGAIPNTILTLSLRSNRVAPVQFSKISSIYTGCQSLMCLLANLRPSLPITAQPIAGITVLHSCLHMSAVHISTLSLSLTSALRFCVDMVTLRAVNS